MGIPRITPGLELVDDEGDLVVVDSIDDEEQTVDLETDDGDCYSMTLRELRSKLRDGDFVAVDSETEESIPDGVDSAVDG
ncbi:MAG: hypothetical protein C5B58_01330 [Acidobacteria bacterium]|nr:MAG: hypothetical protein C5B58_01330 [Acidobacteriota bacterium]